MTVHRDYEAELLLSKQHEARFRKQDLENRSSVSKEGKVLVWLGFAMQVCSSNAPASRRLIGSSRIMPWISDHTVTGLPSPRN
eukprot:2384555-Amphidinium_carterae.1